MNYEEEYNAIVQRCRELHESGNALTKQQMEIVCPQLKESEGERIRKALINGLKDSEWTHFSDVLTISEIIAWLEKQGEQKLTLPKWKYKKDHTPLLRDSLILNKYGCVAKSPSGAIVSDVWVIDYDELAKLPKEEFEKQGEQKPVPKFKIGDTMRTLQEAKDGWTDGMPFVVSIDSEYYNCNSEKIAIKDQDEYEYPPMNRKHDICDSCDEQQPAKQLGGTFTSYDMAKTFTEGQNYVIAHPEKFGLCKPAEWSEKDEGMINCIIATLCEESHGGRETNDKMVTWLDNRLKSLRPQPHWKPSEEQMDALEEAVYQFDGSEYSNGIDSLLIDLQKLL